MYQFCRKGIWGEVWEEGERKLSLLSWTEGLKVINPRETLGSTAHIQMLRQSAVHPFPKPHICYPPFPLSLPFMLSKVLSQTRLKHLSLSWKLDEYPKTHRCDPGGHFSAGGPGSG